MGIEDEKINAYYRMEDFFKKLRKERITYGENWELTEVINDFYDVEDYPYQKKTFAIDVVSNESSEDDNSRNNLEMLKKELKEVKKSIARLERQNSDLNKRVNELIDKEKTKVEEYSIKGLKEIGFRPVTEDVLKNYREEEVVECKKIIKREIIESNGYTDPLMISEKYNLSLRLVAGCFDSLLKNGEIGEVAD